MTQDKVGKDRVVIWPPKDGSGEPLGCLVRELGTADTVHAAWAMVRKWAVQQYADMRIQLWLLERDEERMELRFIEAYRPPRLPSDVPPED